MRGRLLAASVMVLSLATTTTVWADEASAPTPSTPPAQTSMPTRPNHPIALAPTNEGTPLGYKLVAGAVVALAAGLWIRNKRRTALSAAASTRIDVLGRTSLGVRSELIVVHVDGMRLLVGMTPSSIQTLAVLETPPEPAEAAADRVDADDAAGDALFERERARPTSDLRALVAPAIDTRPLRSLLSRRREEEDDAADSAPLDARPSPGAPTPAPARRAPAKAAKSATPRTTRIAGQARGLMLALEEPAEGKAAARTPRSL